MGTPLGRPARVFVSYARVDAEYRQALFTHLATLRNQGLIADWHDGEVVPGEEWDTEIHRHLDAADIIVLLLSASFFESDYINRVEIPRVLERHADRSARVVPVIVRAVHWSGTPLKRIQGLPENGKPVKSWDDPDEAWANVAAGIERVVKSLEPRRFGDSSVGPPSARSHDREATPTELPAFKPPLPVLPSGTRILVALADGLLHAGTVRQYAQGYYELELGTGQMLWVPMTQVTPQL